MATAPTSRTREKAGGEEEATADLKLGEFQNVPTLTLSEARLLITSIIGHRRTQRNVTETEFVNPPRSMDQIWRQEADAWLGR